MLMYLKLQLKTIRRRRFHRAITNMLDFLLALTLFINHMATFILILVNTSTTVLNQTQLQDDPAKLLAQQILSSSGSTNWAEKNSFPTSFGLSSTNTLSSNNLPYIDINKLARLNRELLYSGSFQYSNYSFVDPNIVQKQLANYSTQNTSYWSISTSPVLDVSASSAYVNSFSSLENIFVQVNTWNGTAVPNAIIDIYAVSLLDGSRDFFTSGQKTNINGELSLQINLSQSINHILVIYAHIGSLWGLYWLELTGRYANKPIVSSGLMSSMMVLSNNSINEYVTRTSPYISNQIFIHTSYFNTQTNTISFPQFENQTYTGNTNAPIYHQFFYTGFNAPLIQIVGINGNASYYRVFTLPQIFDNNNFHGFTNGEFLHVQLPVYETTGFTDHVFTKIYTYSTLVESVRGPLLMKFEVGII